MPARSGAGVAGEIGARAEIHQDDASAFFAHDVSGLHVAVEQADAVHGGQGAAEIEADRCRFARAERALRGQQI